MGFDQNITYRVNVDDSNFQAKLTQMRASMDSVMGGAGGGMGGMSSNMMYGMMGMAAGSSSYGPVNMGGLSDFGSQIRPVTYTPPAIAMQPHFGMVQIQQTLGQAGLATIGGPMGASIGGMMTNFRNGGIGGVFSGPDAVPPQISLAEYGALSARSFGSRAGDASAMALLTAGSTGASIAAGGAGSAVGSSLFSSGIGRFVGGALGGMVGGMVVSEFTGQIVDTMANNRAIQSQLESGSFRFMNGGPGTDPLTGRGFDRRTRAGLASRIQDMEMNDVRFGSGEYGQILESGMQMDMFSGTKDAEDFGKKFKGLVENIKTVTSTLHTSLKEGMEVIRGFRDMGVTDPSMVNQMVLRSETLGRTSGRTGMEMLAIGQAGAEIFRGTGIEMGKGFELNQQNTAMVRQMLNSGNLSRETVAQAGGENALGQQMTSNALAGFQTTLGRGALLANFDPSTGSMRAGFMERMAGQGSMAMVENAGRMRPQDIIKFQAHQEEIISNMSPMQMQLFGMSTRVAQARDIQRVMGGTLEDSFTFSSRMQGMSIENIHTELAMMKQDPDQMRRDGQTALDSMRTQVGLEDFRNRFGTKVISNWWNRNAVKPISDTFMGVSTAVGNATDRIAMTLTGSAAVNSETAGSEYLLSTGRSIEQRNRMSGNISANARYTDATGGFFARRLGQTSEELAENFNTYGTLSKDGSTLDYNGSTARLFKNEDDVRAYMAKSGESMTRIGSRDGRILAIADSQMAANMDHARGMQATQKDQDEVKKQGLDIERRKDLQYLAANNGGKDVTLQQAANAVFGDNFDYKAWASGDGKYSYNNMSSSQISAKLGAYLNKDSDLLGGALKEYNAKTSTRAGSDTAGRSRKELIDEADTSRARSAALLETGLTTEDLGRRLLGVGKLRGANAEQITKIIQGIDDKDASGTKRIEARDTLKELGFEDVNTIMKNFDSLSKEKKDQLLKNANQIAANVAAADEKAKAASGGQGVGGASVIGDLSKDTLMNLEKMSNQLLENYNQLMAMQKQFNELKSQGRKL